VLESGGHGSAGCVSVLDHVGERFADHEIGRRLHTGREALHRHFGTHWDRDPGHKCLDSGAEPATYQRRGEDPVRQFAQLGVRVLGVAQRLGDQVARVRVGV
jgi:hypothetical protein